MDRGGYGDGYAEGYYHESYGMTEGYVESSASANHYYEQPEYSSPAAIVGAYGEQCLIPSPVIYETRRQVRFCAVTSVEYDNSHELLWAGYDDGRVSSYLMQEAIQDEWTDPLHAAGRRFSSFMSFAESPVVQVLPYNNQYVMSVGTKELRIHTIGGMPYGAFGYPIKNDTDQQTFSCASFLRPQNTLVTSEDLGPTHLVVGSTCANTFAYDLRRLDKPCSTYNTSCSTTKIATSSGGNQIICGGSDGKLRIIDGRLRSPSVKHTLDAHSGPVSDVSVQPDGFLVLSCGVISRPINQFDPKSPISFVPDPLVRVFDVRMNRQLKPLSMSMGTPSVLKFIPSPSGDGTTSVLMAGATGVLQLSSLEGVADPPSMQVFFVPLSDRKEKLTHAAASSSGHFIAGGVTGGSIIQFALGLPPDAGMAPKVNFSSQLLREPPSRPKPPPLSADVNDEFVTGLYALLGREGDPEPLASSFLATPQLLSRTIKSSPRRRISEELMAKVSWKDFIGTISNPGLKTNSFIFGEQAGKTCYPECDPRKKAQAGGGHVEKNTTLALAVPAHLRYTRSHRGKQRMMRFDYSFYNKTQFIGLENTNPNTYTIPILQFLYFVPEIRATALLAQMSPFHHVNATTLWCELGFLYHMMRSCQNWHLNNANNSQRGDMARVATPANFQRTYQQVSEAVALSLFDGSLADVQLLLQTFSRFLFQQLQSEHDLEAQRFPREDSSPASAVEHIFGYSVGTTTTFLLSGTQEVGAPNRAFTIDVVYPSINKAAQKLARAGLEPAAASLTPGVTPNVHTPSFASVLWGSVQKESHMKGWCSASERYEPFKQVRSMLSAPRMLSLLCGATVRDPKEATISGALGEAASIGSMHLHFWSKKNSAGGPWLPVEMEMAFLRKSTINSGRSSVLSLVVSTKMLLPQVQSEGEVGKEEAAAPSSDALWIVFDGKKESMSTAPASQTPSSGISEEAGWVVSAYNLLSVVSQVSSFDKDISSEVSKHCVLHVRTNSKLVVPHGPEEPMNQWMSFNDFVIAPSSPTEATTFPDWRHPCMIFFCRKDYEDEHLSKQTTSPKFPLIDADKALIPGTVLSLTSLSQTQSIRLPVLTSLPDKGDLIAFDGEFVSVELERASVNDEGQRVVSDEGRQVLARISLVDGGPRNANQPRSTRIIADDYILPCEPVADYVTRFSGIVADDLSPALSRHAVVTNRTAYLKLRFFLDRGCIFVGHGLQKDFETANVFVPPEQVLDTVELWRIENSRKISLRFLASYVLKIAVQDEIHDSIEDAKTALALYRKFQELSASGQDAVMKALQELYDFGMANSWTIGIENIK